MKVQSCLLCDFVEVREGLAMIVGGAITRLWRQALPAPMNCMLAVVLEIHRQELGVPHELRVQVMGPDAELGGAVAAFNLDPAAFDLEVGESLVVCLPLDLRGIPVQAYGGHTIDLAVDSTHLGELSFRVRATSQHPGAD